tara:strand:- start:74 stop:412 length:339 start_codon:yes stop_codon:yes gene_type:complete
MAKKNKFKRMLKKAAPLIAAGLGAAALAKGRNRAASIGDVEASEAGFGNMRLKDYGPHSIGGYHKPRTDSVLASPKWGHWGADYMPMKKGGRVRGAGKAKRGLGRAFSKGGK